MEDCYAAFINEFSGLSGDDCYCGLDDPQDIFEAFVLFDPHVVADLGCTAWENIDLVNEQDEIAIIKSECEGNGVTTAGGEGDEGWEGA